MVNYPIILTHNSYYMFSREAEIAVQRTVLWYSAIAAWAKSSKCDNPSQSCLHLGWRQSGMICHQSRQWTTSTLYNRNRRQTKSTKTKMSHQRPSSCLANKPSRISILSLVPKISSSISVPMLTILYYTSFYCNKIW